jgi:GntR family transcriptional regulator
MEFRDHQAIYLQIADYVCEKILLQSWKMEERIPSIRDLAIELQVNPNTVQRSYDFLQELEIISNRRGVGIFVEKDAFKRIMAYKRKEFTSKALPALFKNMTLLKMDIKDLEILYNKYLETHSKKLK